MLQFIKNITPTEWVLGGLTIAGAGTATYFGLKVRKQSKEIDELKKKLGIVDEPKKEEKKEEAKAEEPKKEETKKEETKKEEDKGSDGKK